MASRPVCTSVQCEAVRREQHGQAGRRGPGRLQRHPVHVRLHLPHVRRHRRRPLLCHGQQGPAKLSKEILEFLEFDIIVIRMHLLSATAVISLQKSTIYYGFHTFTL